MRRRCSLVGRTVAFQASGQGRYAEAEPLHKRALSIREKALGPKHADLATSLNDLAELYRAQGHYADAELLFKRALAIWEMALGPNHPSRRLSASSPRPLLSSQIILLVDGG